MLKFIALSNKFVTNSTVYLPWQNQFTHIPSNFIYSLAGLMVQCTVSKNIHPIFNSNHTKALPTKQKTSPITKGS